MPQAKEARLRKLPRKTKGTSLSVRPPEEAEAKGPDKGFETSMIFFGGLPLLLAADLVDAADATQGPGSGGTSSSRVHPPLSGGGPSLSESVSGSSAHILKVLSIWCYPTPPILQHHTHIQKKRLPGRYKNNTYNNTQRTNRRKRQTQQYDTYATDAL